MPIYKKVNKDFFKKWTAEMSYVLGFFAADGYITTNKRGARFWSIQITDRDLIYLIRKTVGSEHKIGLRKGDGKNKDLYRLQIGSLEMCSDLESLGFKDNKTSSLCVPKVPDRYLPDFVRGYFDGDGNVWSGYAHKDRRQPSRVILSVFTSCSERFLAVLKSKLNGVGLVGGSLIRSDRNYFRLSFGTADTLKLFDFMYNGIDLEGRGLFLKRKAAIFQRYVSTRA